MAALVADGGAAGCLLRAALREALPPPAVGWSWATLCGNAVGALALGALLRPLTRHPSERLRLVLATGLLGAFTTFSGLAVEAVELVRAGRPGSALAYVLVSVAVLLGAAVLGDRAVRR